MKAFVPFNKCIIYALYPLMLLIKRRIGYAIDTRSKLEIRSSQTDHFKTDCDI